MGGFKIQAKQLQKELSEAQRLIKSNEMKSAKAILLKLKEQTKNKPLFHAGIMLNLIQVVEDEKKYIDVIEYSSEIIEYLKNNIKIFSMIKENITFIGTVLIKKADAYLELNQVQNAIDIFNEVITLNLNYMDIIDSNNMLYAYQGIGGIQLSLSQNINDQNEKDKLLRMARANMKKSLQINPYFFPTYTFLAVIYNNLGDNDKAEDMYEKSILLPMKKEIQEISVDNLYYKYVSINDDKTLKNLINKELYISDPQNFNDPFDCPVFRGNNYKNSIGLSRVLDKIRISCFSKVPDSILMWSHYGDSHNGICIGYRITKNYLIENKLHFGEIDYKDKIPSNDDRENFKGFLNNTFYIKNNVWSYEEEVRVLGYDLNVNPIPAPIVEEVIFGINISESNKKTIRSIFSNYEDITYYEVIEKDSINMELQEVSLTVDN